MSVHPSGRPAPSAAGRVALLSPCFWPEVRRGGERFVAELAEGLRRRGVGTRLITSHPGRPTLTTESGLAILRLPRPPQGPLVRRGYEQYLTHVPLSYAALRAGDYAVAHAVYPTDALAAARWRARSGRPALLSYLGIPDEAGLAQRRWHREFVARALEHTDRVVALSQHAAAAFAASFGYRAPVIPPGVDLRAFTVGGERSPVPTIICSAVATEPRKHVRLLLRAFTLVRAELPDAELWLSAPQALPDAPGVRWLDLDDRGALARAYRHAWVAALPAESEAFGLVLAEALACGTPVVGYADAAIPELIDSARIGRLFAALEPAALAGALLESLALSQRPETPGHCRVRAEAFSHDRCAEAYLTLYRSLGATV
ncbi:glycosyltransferase family 4 protein [Conexibacter sp. DBS9H8]|uniref:glycosyltransferase family 4 protein n=1 Tax=Conexibacter sp. DBS9H8 TaxID=2937801 RepID=UPI00200C43E6|nr:glycosyltransferase family 4 protein [Conexibacter sp. DBS9H8]